MDWTYFDSEVVKFNKTNKNKKERKAFRDHLREQVKTKDKKYLDEEDAIDYYFDMIFGQKFALVNREVMIQNISGKLDWSTKKIESIHNYIDFTDFGHGKELMLRQVKNA